MREVCKKREREEKKGKGESCSAIVGGFVHACYLSPGSHVPNDLGGGGEGGEKERRRGKGKKFLLRVSPFENTAYN